MEGGQEIKCPKCGKAMKKKEGLLYASGEQVYICSDPVCSTTAKAPDEPEK